MSDTKQRANANGMSDDALINDLLNEKFAWRNVADAWVGTWMPQEAGRRLQRQAAEIERNHAIYYSGLYMDVVTERDKRREGDPVFEAMQALLDKHRERCEAHCDPEPTAAAASTTFHISRKGQG